MAESIHIPASLTKTEKYEALLPQLEALMDEKSSAIANLANTAAALKEVFGWFWVGFYLVQGNELVLGPFQGPVACTRIAFGKGVCGSAWKEKRPILVPDVEAFPGHIACSSQSRSEIVIPLETGGSVYGVLDIDSIHLNDFDENDLHGLQKLVEVLNRSMAETR